MILKLTDYMKYYYALIATRFSKPSSLEEGYAGGLNLSTAFVVRQDFMPVRSFDAGTSSFNDLGRGFLQT